MAVYLLYGDEANLEPQGAIEFFLYGGIWLPVDRLGELHHSMTTIRSETGFLPGDRLKFSPKERPRERVTAAQHLSAKQRVIELATRLGVQFAAVAAHHDVARNRTRRWRYQVDTLLLAFRDFLREDGSTGLVVLDRFDELSPTLRRDFREESSLRPEGSMTCHSTELPCWQLARYSRRMLGRWQTSSLACSATA
jgi:hypothetical protein